MGTWLDTQPTMIIRRALAANAIPAPEDGTDQRYGLWLELVDLHLDQLRVGRHQLDWDWQRAYEDGWSPRTAAFAAWAKHLRPVHTTEEE